MEKIKFLLDEIEKAGIKIKNENIQLKEQIIKLNIDLQNNLKSENKIIELELKIKSLEKKIFEFNTNEEDYKVRLAHLNKIFNNQKSVSTVQDVKSSKSPGLNIANNNIANNAHLEESKNITTNLNITNEFKKPIPPEVSTNSKNSDVFSKLKEKTKVNKAPEPQQVSEPQQTSKNNKQKNNVPPWERWEIDGNNSFFEIEEDPFSSNEEKEDDQTFSENIKKF